MKRCVIIIDDGRIEDVLTSSKEPMDIMIVDFDKKTLDQSVLHQLSEPHDFEDVAALADIYKWDAFYDPKKVKDVFAVKRGP
jgi:hypothetical protein